MYMGFSGYFIKPIRKHIKQNYYPIPVLICILVISGCAWWGSQIEWYIYTPGGLTNVGWMIKMAISLFTLLLVAVFYELRGKQLVSFVNQFEEQ
jgi:hypothetical protein